MGEENCPGVGGTAGSGHGARVLGPPDIIAYVKVGEWKKLRELVLQRFHRVEGIQATDTHIVVEI